jgi:hypothetical protein
LKTYAYKASPDQPQLGLIAQEVDRVFPQGVFVADAHGLKDCHMLDLTQVVMCLLGAVKDLQSAQSKSCRAGESEDMNEKGDARPE